jgi:hypothetical protein
MAMAASPQLSLTSSASEDLLLSDIIGNQNQCVIALKYLDDPEVQDGHFGVWWAGNTQEYTEEPWAHLLNFEESFLRDLMENRPGQRVLLTGKRRRKRRHDETGVRPMALSNKVAFQDSSGYCALNAVRNLVSLSPAVVTAVKAFGPLYSHTALSRYLAHSVESPICLVKVKDQRDKIRFIQKQTTGQYSIYSQGHCISWDATNGVVSDTDPDYPSTLPTSMHTLAYLNIVDINLIYQVKWK